MKIQGLLFIAVWLALASCGPKRIPESCNGVICTAEFRMLTVYLQDSLGNAYTPDKVETYDVNAHLINMQTIPAVPGGNAYTYIDDHNLSDLGVNMANEVIFKVIKHNATVKQDTFTVKADCCHVIKISGADTLTVP